MVWRLKTIFLNQGQTGKSTSLSLFFVPICQVKMPINTLYKIIYKSMDSKRIGNFKQFLNEQRQKKINEARVSLEVEWWDQCILEIMEIMKDECAGSLEYETLINYIKGKFQILGRPDPGYDEGFLLQHIKDLIFQLHGDSFVCDGMCNWGDTSEIQAKGLVVSELAKVIMDKIMETIKTPDDPIQGVTQVSLVDRKEQEEEPYSCIDDNGTVEYEYDDLPFEGKRPVKKFKEYSKMLKETVAMIDCDSQEDCINYALDVIKKLVGSLDANEIADYSYQTACTEVKTKLVLGLVKGIVYDYLTNQKGQVKIVGIGNPKDVKENVPKDVFEQGLNILCDDIADEILGRIANENGVYHEQIE